VAADADAEQRVVGVVGRAVVGAARAEERGARERQRSALQRGAACLDRLDPAFEPVDLHARRDGERDGVGVEVALGRKQLLASTRGWSEPP